MNRIRENSVQVMSPFGRGISEVSLRPEDVIAIVFWTKDAGPLSPHLEELSERGHCFTFLYTVNNYPENLEPHVPELGHTINVMENLTRNFPTATLRWRYDPIVITNTMNRQWHLKNFRELCRLVAPFSSECIFSFCDYYKKTIRNMERGVADYKVPDENACVEMGLEMASIAADSGITLSACAHDFLVSDRIAKARCIDTGWLTRVADTAGRRDALMSVKNAPSRKECGCAASKDIGAYNTCAHQCVYCYANANAKLARTNAASLGPDRACLDPKAPAPGVSAAGSDARNPVRSQDRSSSSN